MIANMAILVASSGVIGAENLALDAQAILAEHCWACHGPDSATREADLRLDDRTSALSVLTPGDPAGSELLARVESADPDQQMPPGDAKKLSPQQVATLSRWIASGAEYEVHWAFQPPRRKPLPKPEAYRDWARNEIDHFVLSKLDRLGIRPAALARPSVRVRRATLDLTGLPPTPDEVARFVARDREDPEIAWQELIDRLLNSPRYGERMAADWLDVARYADTDGYQNDRYRYMHVWRDWVIMAFNEHLPYDQFLIQQLAGDMLPAATLKQQIATGFCRNHRITSEDGSIPEEWQVEYVVDRVDTLGTAILGLTISCARCHDHKFDPISQDEYYQLFAYFNNVPEWGVGPNNGNSPPFIEVPPSWPALRANENVALTPEPLQLKPARENEPGNGLKRPQAGSPQTVMVMQEMTTPRTTYRLVRGQYHSPDRSRVIRPGVPRALSRAATSRPTDRLELARWLVHPDHPLTARVVVNRLWQQFFGVGLVKTSENFGLQGERPSHPDLLDWLAIRLIDTNWDLAALQRLIMSSATYQQTSRLPSSDYRSDPENRWLSRGARFRLHPFMLRDQALAASGLLVESLGGPSAKPYMPPRIWRSISNNTYEQDSGANLYRRSLYTYWRRTIPPPTMMNFNAAEREVCVVRKDRTNTPMQALTVMNNVTFVEASRRLAARSMQVEDTVAGQIRHAFVRLTAREPTDNEMSILREAYDSFLAQFARDRSSALRLLQVGAMPCDEALDSASHAALTMTASLIMNLDEVLNKP